MMIFGIATGMPLLLGRINPFILRAYELYSLLLCRRDQYSEHTFVHNPETRTHCKVMMRRLLYAPPPGNGSKEMPDAGKDLN